MKFSDMWKFAGVIAEEFRFQGFLEANPLNRARMVEDPEEAIKRIKRSTGMSSAISSIFIILLAFISISSVPIGPPETIHIRLAIAISLFLVFSFVIVFFINLMATTGIFSSSIMDLPSALPVGRNDLENLLLLSFIRVFIAPVIIITIVYPIMVAITIGIIAGILSFLACVCTVSVALGSLIKVSKWFYIKSHSSLDSKSSTVIRIFAGLGLVVGMFSAYTLSNYVTEILAIIIELDNLSGQLLMTLLSAVFPFSLGVLSSIVAFGLRFSLATSLVSVGATIIYAYLAVRLVMAGRRTLRTVAIGQQEDEFELETMEKALEVSSTMRGIIRKDMKLATRSLGSLALLALPVLMVFSVVPVIGSFGAGIIRSFIALAIVFYVNLFSGLVLIGLLGLDTQGASIHAGLPLGSNMILRSKAIEFMIPQTITMVVFAVLFLFNQLISPLLVLIPLFQIPLMYGLALMIGVVIFRIRGDGRATSVNMAGDQGIVLLTMILSALIGSFPLIGYGISLLSYSNHLLAIATQLAIALLFSIFAHFASPRLLKD